MARIAERDHNYMRKQLIQKDLLKVGERHLVRLDEKIKSRTKPKECIMEVLGCYPDYYLMKDELGIKYSLLKSDLYCGVWGVQGLDPKTKLIKIAEKIQGPEPEVEKMNAKEELEMAAKNKMEELIEKSMEWLEERPGEGLHINTEFPGYKLNGPQAKKIRDVVLERMNEAGKEVVLEGKRPIVLVYKGENKLKESAIPWDDEVDEYESEIEMTKEEVENTETEAESEIQMTKAYSEIVEEPQKEIPKVTDREFLESKKKSLTWQIQYNQEMWEIKKVEHEVRQEMMKTMLNEINSHLNAQGGPQ